MRWNSKKFYYQIGSHLQVHENSGYALTPIFGVIIFHKVVKVRLILLPNFVVENLKPFAMLCTPCQLGNR
jgi:hypothetical protein